MNIEYYAFALFVAGLICGIAIICKVLFSNVKRQQKLLDERETQILQLYTSVETLMEEFNDQVKAATEEIKEHERRATLQMAAFELPPELEKRENVLEKLPRTLPLDANRIRAAGEVLERAERIVKSDEIVIPAYVPPPYVPGQDNAGSVVPGRPTASAASVAPQAYVQNHIGVPVARSPVPAVVNSVAPNQAGATVSRPSVVSGGAGATAPVFQKFFDESAEAPPPQELSSTQTRSEAIMTLSREGKSDVEIASQLGITRNEVQLVVDLMK